MTSQDQQRAYRIALYLASWAISLAAALLIYWPQDTARETTGDPNEAAVPQADVQGRRTTVLLLDKADMDVGRLYEATDKVDTTFVLAPARLPVAGLDLAILVLAMGALGACLHGMTSLAIHLGKQNFGAEWTLWYVYRPFVGGVLALIFHLIITGGFMPQINTGTGGFFGMIGLAGLIGLFSKQALNTLSKLFDVIFTSDDDGRTAVTSPSPGAPQLDAIDPPKIPQSDKATNVTLKGSNFTKGAVVKIGDQELTTTFKSDKELIAVIPKERLAEPGNLKLVVVNPEPQGGASKPQTLNVK